MDDECAALKVRVGIFFYLVDGCATLRVRVGIFGGRRGACLCATLRVRVGILFVGVCESQS